MRCATCLRLRADLSRPCLDDEIMIMMIMMMMMKSDDDDGDNGR